MPKACAASLSPIASFIAGVGESSTKKPDNQDPESGISPDFSPQRQARQSCNQTEINRRGR
jgi:hypothetical protein